MLTSVFHLLLHAIACYYYNKNNTHLKKFLYGTRRDPLKPKSSDTNLEFFFLRNGLFLSCFVDLLFISFLAGLLCGYVRSFSFFHICIGLMRYGHFSKKFLAQLSIIYLTKYNCYEIQTLVFVGK